MFKAAKDSKDQGGFHDFETFPSLASASASNLSLSACISAVCIKTATNPTMMVTKRNSNTELYEEEEGVVLGLVEDDTIGVLEGWVLSEPFPLLEGFFDVVILKISLYCQWCQYVTKEYEVSSVSIQ